MPMFRVAVKTLIETVRSIEAVDEADAQMIAKSKAFTHAEMDLATHGPVEVVSCWIRIGTFTPKPVPKGLREDGK